MSYETAPATLMVAIACACCARPLVDAVSVETGIGPDCRKKYGFGEAQGPALWDVAEKALSTGAGLGLSTAFHDAFRTDAHKCANVLVHRIAIEQKGESVGLMVRALAALGYSKLAARIADRLGAIKVTTEEGRYVTETPWNAVFISHVRGIEGRMFDKPRKAWTVPASARVALWTAIKAAFPVGTLVITSGMVTVL